MLVLDAYVTLHGVEKSMHCHQFIIRTRVYNFTSWGIQNLFKKKKTNAIFYVIIQ